MACICFLSPEFVLPDVVQTSVLKMKYIEEEWNFINCLGRSVKLVVQILKSFCVTEKKKEKQPDECQY